MADSADRAGFATRSVAAQLCARTSQRSTARVVDEVVYDLGARLVVASRYDPDTGALVAEEVTQMTGDEELCHVKDARPAPPPAS